MMEQAKKSAGAVGSSSEILSLLRSHANRDERRFISVALELAEDAARKGHVRLAEEMQAVIDEAKAATLRLRPPKRLFRSPNPAVSWQQSFLRRSRA